MQAQRKKCEKLGNERPQRVQVLNGIVYVVSQGNITATIRWFATTTGATAGLSYYKEKESN